MQRIYLDQNKWVDLARARTGHDLGKPFVEAYEAAKAAAQNGQASFPLSAAHYFETHKQSSEQRRRDLAETMLELSRHDAIAPAHVIVPHEIEMALIEVLGLAHQPPLRYQYSGGEPITRTVRPSSLTPPRMSSAECRSPPS